VTRKILAQLCLRVCFTISLFVCLFIFILNEVTQRKRVRSSGVLYRQSSAYILSPCACSNPSFDSCGHCSIHHSALKCFSGNASQLTQSSVLLQSTSYFTLHMYSCFLSRGFALLGIGGAIRKFTNCPNITK